MPNNPNYSVTFLLFGGGASHRVFQRLVYKAFSYFHLFWNLKYELGKTKISRGADRIDRY